MQRPTLLERAKAGDTGAQRRLADRLMSPETPSAFRAAMPWLRRRTAAIAWYERAAAQGYGSAQLNLGIILANLPGAARDEARAVRLNRSAARR